MKIRRPRHTTVVAYLALFVAVATGGAYAAETVTSSDIEDGAIKSVDIKNRKGVKGIDVKTGSLKGKQIAERSLDASQFAPVAGSESGECDPASSSFTNCASVTMSLKRPSRVLAIASGGQISDSATPTSGACEVRIDGTPQAFSSFPGEAASDNTSGTATNGFARTLVTPQPLPAGSHSVALACNEGAGDVAIDNPTIAAIAIAKP